ncbi:GNAT family N-acetyltransferase [Catellatospora tritici]|uniref:GNAT family N-acetyltransferase n=1 Tax=Catellatospora tritici TaxID=2851566 RepID=UPI001C2CF385|nr:GNAT family N-acetyltransferase [Catellatospora tritici]MBV1850259.1 GNAT family N-acetyltransferase [Catellatospora tritici]
MDLTPFDAADADSDAVADWHRVHEAAAAVDDPDHPHLPEAALAARLAAPPPSTRTRHWLAKDGDEPVGTATLSLSDRENLDWGFAEVVVHPAYRRRGHGTALLTAVRAGLAEAGRTTLVFDVGAESAGSAFAAAAGARRAQTLWESELDLVRAADELPDDREPAGYRAVRWSGAAPDELVASYVAAAEAMGDSPDGGLGYQVAPGSVEHTRAVEQWWARRGCQLRTVVALHEGTGVVAGLTVVAVPLLHPQLAYQEDTAVVPAHRGHGLGLWLKARMVRWLVADGMVVRRIRTTTDPSNTHMLDINARLGFHRTRVREQWVG